MLGDILFGPLEAAMDILIDLLSMWQSHFFGPLSPGITFFWGGQTSGYNRCQVGHHIDHTMSFLTHWMHGGPPHWQRDAP